MKDTTFILNETEYIVLLMLYGVRKVYGLELSPLGGEPEKIVAESIFTLEKKRLINQIDGKIELVSRLRYAIDNIVNSERILTVTKDEGSYLNLCIYFGRNGLTATEKIGETGRKIRIQEYNSIVECFDDRDIFLHETIDDDELYVNQEIDKESMPALISKTEELRLIYLTKEDRETIYKEIVIQMYDGGPRDYIFILEEEKYYAYSRKKLLELLEQM